MAPASDILKQVVVYISSPKDQKSIRLEFRRQAATLDARHRIVSNLKNIKHVLPLPGSSMLLPDAR